MKKCSVVILIGIGIILLGGVVFVRKTPQYLMSDSELQRTPNPRGENTQPNEIQPIETPDYQQHIVAIPNSDEAWYEIPEIGVKLLVSKVVAEDLIYVYEPVYNETVEKTTISFFSKRASTFDSECTKIDSPFRDPVYLIQRFSGKYDGRPLPYGMTFLKQYNGFYLTDGGSAQGACFTEEETGRFDTTIAPAMPSFPKLTEIQIKQL